MPAELLLAQSRLAGDHPEDSGMWRSELHCGKTFGEQLSGVMAELGQQERDSAPLLSAGS
jgi:hypothetical protein